jgi:NADPH:quinone reductase
MKAMAIKSYGSIDSLELMEIPERVPGANEVRVKVIGSALNPADSKVITGKIKFLHGRKFPLVVGYDFAGEIDLVGSGVTSFKVGDRVFGFLPYGITNNQGAFCEKIVAKVGAISKVPTSLTFEQAASCSTAALTALQGLRKTLSKQNRKKILINGASGGVGVFAVQIAKILGATVTATCSSGSIELVKSLGADEVIDYRKTPALEISSTYNVVFDVASNLSFFKARKLLKSGGRYVTLLPSPVVMGGVMLSPILNQKCSMVMVKSIDKDLKQISQWIDEKRLKIPIEKTYPLKDLAQALHRLDKGGIQGKIAITI